MDLPGFDDVVEAPTGDDPGSVASDLRVSRHRPQPARAQARRQAKAALRVACGVRPGHGPRPTIEPGRKDGEPTTNRSRTPARADAGSSLREIRRRWSAGVPARWMCFRAHATSDATQPRGAPRPGRPGMPSGSQAAQAAKVSRPSGPAPTHAHPDRVARRGEGREAGPGALVCLHRSPFAIAIPACRDQCGSPMTDLREPVGSDAKGSSGGGEFTEGTVARRESPRARWQRPMSQGVDQDQPTGIRNGKRGKASREVSGSRSGKSSEGGNPRDAAGMKQAQQGPKSEPQGEGELPRGIPKAALETSRREEVAKTCTCRW